MSATNTNEVLDYACGSIKATANLSSLDGAQRNPGSMGAANTNEDLDYAWGSIKATA